MENQAPLIHILEATQDYVICVKPAGVLSQEGSGPNMPALLREQLGGDIFPVHRLDREVGGVMVFARNSASAGWFGREIQEGRLKKEYLTVVHGVPEPETGILEDLLLHDARRNKSFVVDRKRKGVRDAKLSYRTLVKGEDRSLLQVRLFTGRSHQIRVQFASRKHPLLGDGRYGGGSGQMALWSVRLTLRVPGRKEARSYCCLPGELGGFSEFPELSDME